MGEVYRATDARLKRNVAIKVLPAAFTAEPERLARFEREAQVLAQLHHPNIASIFGLAKAMDPASSASGPAQSPAASPTFTQGATLQGVILGTAAYKAPEQAKGFPVDKRADIWAFGVVLYEMLTGQRMFRGDSVSDTLAGVLKNEIDLSALPPATPPAIRRLLRRCLAAPADRTARSGRSARSVA